MRLPRMTTRRLMVAVAVAATLLGLGINTVRHTEFRRVAANYYVFDLRDPAGLTLRDRAWRRCRNVMAYISDRIADWHGEPERLDPFPGVPFEEIIKSSQEQPGCRFPLDQ